METACEYHPTRPAEWNCPSCNDSFCGDCIDKRIVEQYGKKKAFQFCPKCNVELERLAFQNSVVSFWNRLPKFFVYPFHPRALIFMAAVSILAVLAAGQGLFKLLLQFAVWGVVLKYSFAALKATANGNLTPPKVNLHTISDDFELVFKQILMYGIIGFVFVMVVKVTGIFLGFLFLGLAILSIYAMIMVLVATNSLLHAINPMVFVPMAWRIGWAYLLMYLFLMLLGVAPAILGQYIIVFLPDGLHGFLFMMAKCFYTIISYHLMGYVIFQYHEEIGYEVELSDEEVLSEENPPENIIENALLNRIDVFIKEGKLDDAIALVKDQTGGAIEDVSLAERYFNLLRIRERTSEMLEHGKGYLELLAKEDQKDKLRDVYLKCLSKDAEFTTSPSAAFKIASSLNETGDGKGAIDVYKRFIKTNPQNPLIPKAYFLAANVINEKLKNPHKAVSILKGLMKKYPNHEIIPYAERYLGQINVS